MDDGLSYLREPTLNETLIRAEQAEVRVKELERAIKRHKRRNPWKTLTRGIDQELYDLVEKGGEDG